MYSHLMTNVVLILYIWSIELFFFLSPKSTLKKTGSSKHWRYESANNAESKLFTKAPVLAPLSAILSQVVGNPKVLLPKMIHEMSFIHDKFCSIRQSSVLLNGQFVWNKKILSLQSIYLWSANKSFLALSFLWICF